MIQMIIGMFNDGGSFMWVILGVMAVACAVVLERGIYLFIYCRGNSYNIVNKMITALEQGKPEDARKVVARKTAPMFVLLRAALDRYVSGAKPERIMDRVEKAAIHEVPRISRRINYLSLLANVSTLMGLLGTILGLQTSFGSMAASDVAQKATLLAIGTAQAMNTTAFGLIVAITCMVMYTILNNRHQAILKEIDEGVAHFIDTIKEKNS
jgi:biopolymer transport protein ExbB/TolQ